MKKFLVLSAVAIITMLSSSVYALQASADDVARYRSEFNNANNKPKKASAEVDLILHDGSRQDPSSYDELKQLVVATYAKYGIKSTNRVVVEKYYQLTALSFPSFRNDAWNDICSKKDSDFWVMYYAMKNGYTNASEQERFDMLAYVLVKPGFNPNMKYNKQAIDALIDLANSVDDTAKVKTVLQKLNRKYTPNLIKDKTTWEPVVAKIRTTLETY